MSPVRSILESIRPDRSSIASPSTSSAASTSTSTPLATTTAEVDPAGAATARWSETAFGASVMRSALFADARFIPKSGLGSGKIGATLAAAPVKTAPTTADKQKALDDYMARASGPYTIKNDKGVVVESGVKVKPHFRLVGGASPIEPGDARAKIEKTLAAKGMLDAATKESIRRVTSGRGTPEDVTRVTQKLIDAGALPPSYDKGYILSSEERIRKLQWEYGIGLDCVGYVAGASAAAAGKKPSELGMGEVNSGVLGGMWYPAANWQKLKTTGDNPLEDAQTGDCVHLTKKGEQFDHNVVVYDHKVLTAKEADQKYGKLIGSSMLSGTGKVHVYEVDSSWGASGVGTNKAGGVNRQVWIYDEGSKKWGSIDTTKATPEITKTPGGPYDHTVEGVYRPK